VSKNNSNFKLEHWIDLFLENEYQDIELYKNVLKDYNAPYLEINSGTGRLTLELLKENYKIDCLENSEELINIAKTKFEKYGFKTNIYQENFLNFSLNKNYNTIFLTGGTFQFIENNNDAISCLTKIYDHISNGGNFIIDISVPWTQILARQENLWKIGKTAINKLTDEKLVVYYSDNFDYLNQIRILQSKYELYKNEQLINTIFQTNNIKWYSQNEFKLMLEKVGFKNIQTREVKLNSFQNNSILFIANRLD